MIAPLLVLTHPGAMAIICVVFAIGGFAPQPARPAFPAPPRHRLRGDGRAGDALGYFATSALCPRTNPTLAGQLQGGQYNYIDPLWMLGTFGFFPTLAVFWLLLLAPGLDGARRRAGACPEGLPDPGRHRPVVQLNGTN